MTDFPTPRFLEARNVRFAVYEMGPEDGRPVLLLHGWPELAYSWKHVMKALASAGYRTIAPDMKGFGASDRPDDIAAYGMDVMTADLATLIEALGYDKVLICGHDWGGAHVWPMAYTYPEKIEGVIGICTPHRKRAPAPPITIFREKFSKRHYIVMFQDPALPDAVFGGKEKLFFEFMFRRTPPRREGVPIPANILDQTDLFQEFKGTKPDYLIMSAEDMAVFEKAYAASGHRTPTHIYRNIDHNWRLTEGVDITVHQPTLMIPAELDVALPPESCDQMPELCPDLELHLLKDCGHWAMWEKPEELNHLMLDWLARRFPA